MELRSRTRVVLAWALWLLTFGCCAAGLLVTLAIYRPLTVAVLAEGALYAFSFVLGFATVGLVLAVRRPGNPIGWLYGAPGLGVHDPLFALGRPADPRAPALAPGGPARRGDRGPELGTRDRARGHAAGPAPAQRSPAVAPLAAGRHQQRDRPRPGHGGRAAEPGTARGDGDRQPVRARRPGRHRRRRSHGRRHPAALAEPAAGGGLRGAAVPVLFRGRAAAAALGRRGGGRRGRSDGDRRPQRARVRAQLDLVPGLPGAA